MLDSRKESLVLEQSLPDDNCSFNAFVLGWCRPDILNKIDRLNPPRQYPQNTLADFIKQAATALGTGMSWFLVKNKLLYVRATDVVFLQKKMTPVFRRLSINLARHNPVFRQRTEMHLKSAFIDFVMPIRASVDEDIFGRHQFIREKFAELNPMPRRSWLSLTRWTAPTAPPTEQDMAAAIEKLTTWWFREGDSGGYERFLRAMETDKVWAGDIELDLLADFFDLNLDVMRKNFIHHIHINYGAIERQLFSEDQVIELRYRGVVDDGDGNMLRFLPLTNSEVEEHLSALPDSDEIRAFVLDVAETLKGRLVPVGWQSSLQQLIQRNIVKRQGDQYYFNCDGNTAANLLEEYPEKEEMLRLWQLRYINKPRIILKNDEATHWDNMRSRAIESELNSFKFQVATLIAANVLYMALLKKHAFHRITFFAQNPLILPSHSETAIIARDQKAEL